MKSVEWMDIIYPANASLMAGYLVAKIAYRLIVRRALGVVSPRMVRIIQWIIVLDSVLVFLELLVVLMLSFLTGADPLLDIESYRDYVVIVRGAMAIVLIGCVSLHVIAIHEFIRQRGRQ